MVGFSVYKLFPGALKVCSLYTREEKQTETNLFREKP